MTKLTFVLLIILQILNDKPEFSEINFDEDKKKEIENNKNVNSHLLSALFLPKYLRIAFDIIVFLRL